MITAERLRELLNYDPETGAFTWRVRRPGRCKVGSAAGSIAKKRKKLYRHIELDGDAYQAHRLAWLYMTGEWPTDQVDHRNSDGLDNRWINLRAATSNENARNAKIRSDNRHGFKGVTWHKTHGKWYAQILIKGKKTFLGLHSTAEAAHAAYVKAASSAFGEFARNG